MPGPDPNASIYTAASEAFVEVLGVYTAAVAAGKDMSASALSRLGIAGAKGLVLRLTKAAEGAIVPELHGRLPAMLDATVRRLAALPPDVQRDLAKNGVAVRRYDAETVVPLEELYAAEARVLAHTLPALK